MAAIPTILTRINNANVNQTGEVSWLGTNGEKAILTELATTLRERGILFIPVDADGNPDIAALGLMGVGDTKFALVQGLAFYGYNPNGGNAAQTSVVAQGGGVWEVLFYLPTTSNNYTKTIGDSISTIFYVNHGLNTETPTIFCQGVLGGLPYTNVQPATYDYQVVDGDNIIITFTSAPASLSTQVVVKI